MDVNELIKEIEGLRETVVLMLCRCVQEAMVCQRCWVKGHIDEILKKARM